MKLGLMQPYFFPYLGYFQLIQAVDRFVLYDDVYFIKNGWINRNRLLLNGQPHYFTVPLRGASSFKRICEVGIQHPASWRRKLTQQLAQAYAKAPQREAMMAVWNETLNAVEPDASVAELARRSILKVMDYLQLGTEIRPSSRKYGNNDLNGQARVLDICQREGATTYINATGGRNLYQPSPFAAYGIALRFITPRLDAYAQLKAPMFVPGLSILDVIAHLPAGDIRQRLDCYELAP